jgi:hypothetical protein
MGINGTESGGVDWIIRLRTAQWQVTDGNEPSVSTNASSFLIRIYQFLEKDSVPLYNIQ